MADALGVSRQTLHNYREIKAHFGVVGLIDGYRMADGTDEKQQRARHATQCPSGNKAQQVAALRAEDRVCGAADQERLNFSFGEEGRAQEVETRDHPFAKEHDWEASRYAGCFVCWPTLIARWRWLELVMGRFGAGWRIFAVFLLMAGLDIRSIEQLKHVRAQEVARVLGLARPGAKTQIRDWFYTVARQGLATGLLGDYCRYQIRAGLVGVWIWFTDGHLLPYTGKEKVHYSDNTQRRMPVPGRTTFNAKCYSVFEQPKELSYSDEQGETHRFTLRHIHIWNRSSDRRTCALVHADAAVLSGLGAVSLRRRKRAA